MRSRAVGVFSSVMLASLSSSQCLAQIDMSDLYGPGKPIEARCACAVPEGSELSVVWEVSPSLSMRPHPSGQTALYVWAPSGKFWVRMTQILHHYELLTVLVPNPTEEDPDGLQNPKTQVIKTYPRPPSVEMFTHQFQVGSSPGPDPEPDPKPDPVTQEVSRVIVLEETSQRTPATAALLQDLRQRGIPGCEVWILDADQPAAADWVKLVSGEPLPQLVGVSPDGKMVVSGQLPATYDEVVEMVGK